MNQTDAYSDIRPYNDSEVSHKIKELLADPVFDRVLLNLYKDPKTITMIRHQLSQVKTIEQLQLGFVKGMVEMIIDTTTDGLTCSGTERLDKNTAYLFISNHRDIILDSAFFNYLNIQSGMKATQIAIGDNLFVYPWITHAVKLNRSFVVKRNIAVRELLKASHVLSEYIRKTIRDDNTSIWIAQKEGRTKDGNDNTQQGLLKMLHMSNKNGFLDGITELNIIPVSISYEIEPCGISKVHETLQKDKEGFKKTTKDDLKSMALGVKNQKGRVHFSYGKPIHSFLNNIDETRPTNDLLQDVAELIDKRIHCNFKLWPNNYLAFDLLNNSNTYSDQYSEIDKSRFEGLIKEAIDCIGDHEGEVRERFLKLYATPVINANKYDS